MKSPLKPVLFVALLIGMPLGAYFWVFRPANQQFQVQQQEIDVKISKLSQLREALDRVNDLDAEVLRLSNAIDFFADKLPAEHEIHKVLAQISTIADRQDLTTTLFQTQDAEPFAGFHELPIKVTMTGNFDAYYQFLIDLEQMPRITRIRQMELKTNAAKDTITSQFMLSVFFQGPSSPPAG